MTAPSKSSLEEAKVIIREACRGVPNESPWTMDAQVRLADALQDRVTKAIASALARARAEQREEDAKVAEGMIHESWSSTATTAARMIAKAIRTGGKP